MQTLKKRQDFLNIANSGIKWVTPAFVIQMGCDFACDETQVGFTASRKVGKAVQRNRAKRRLRDLAREFLPQIGRPSCAYVLIARHQVLSKKYEELCSDIKWAMKRIHEQRDEKHAADT